MDLKLVPRPPFNAMSVGLRVGGDAQNPLRGGSVGMSVLGAPALG